MKIAKVFLGFGLVIAFLSCNNGNKEKMASADRADSVSNAFISSSAAIENNKDSSRRFIRTADLKFKVKSVIKSTYDIEEITNRQGGFVNYSNLASNISNVTTTVISSDSSLETTYYTVTNSIIVRIPNTRLDTTLKEIAKNIDFLDYRIIKAEDVALQILSNNLTQKRTAKNEDRLTNAIDKKGKKLNETASAEEIVLNKQEQSDNAKISNISLVDQVKFSTVNLSIYQKPTIKRELIPNEKNIEAYEPGLGSKLMEAIKYGWEILVDFLAGLTKLWGFILFGLVAYLIYKKYESKSKK